MANAKNANKKQRKNEAFSSFKALRTSKAQILGQIFIFILAGLVFILIITYGYKAVQYFLERQEQVVMVDFRTNLETAVESVKRDFGTVRKLEVKLPTKFQGLCFFDLATCAAKPPELELINQRPMSVQWAQEACLVRSANVFIIPRTQDLLLPDIQIDGGYLCLPNTGVITIRLEGTGKKAKISTWQ